LGVVEWLEGLGAYLEFVLEEVFLGWHFAVETEESLLIGAEGLFDQDISVMKYESQREELTLISTLLAWCGFILLIAVLMHGG
jgi:hypothetical protein